MAVRRADDKRRGHLVQWQANAMSEAPYEPDREGLQESHMSVEGEALAWEEVLAVATSRRRSISLFLELDPAPETRDLFVDLIEMCDSLIERSERRLRELS